MKNKFTEWIGGPDLDNLVIEIFEDGTFKKHPLSGKLDVPIIKDKLYKKVMIMFKGLDIVERAFNEGYKYCERETSEKK